jgi:hypothetical protein
MCAACSKNEVLSPDLRVSVSGEVCTSDLMASFILLQLVVTMAAMGAARASSLTAGFTPVRLTESQFVVQKPYNVPLDARYKFAGGVRRLWVYSTDKPGSPTHPGGARTEIKINVSTLAGAKQHNQTITYSCSTSLSFHAEGVQLGGVAVQGRGVRADGHIRRQHHADLRGGAGAAGDDTDAPRL